MKKDVGIFPQFVENMVKKGMQPKTVDAESLSGRNLADPPMETTNQASQTRQKHAPQTNKTSNGKSTKFLNARL